VGATLAASGGPASAVSVLPVPRSTGFDRNRQLDEAVTRRRFRLDDGWRFALGHANDPKKDFGFGTLHREGTFAKSGHIGGPVAPHFNDSAWRQVQIPHDWAVELPFMNDPELPAHGGKPLGRNYPETSVGWYRLDFTLPGEEDGKRISLEFYRIFRNATVFLNGHFIAQNLSGYVPLVVDVTDYVECASKETIARAEAEKISAQKALDQTNRANKGEMAKAEAVKRAADKIIPGRNSLVVRVDATLDEGWFYEGAGIYRHVWLLCTMPVHVAPWGQVVRSELTSIQSIPGGSGSADATVNVSVEVQNESSSPALVTARTKIVDSSGKIVGVMQSQLRTLEATGIGTIDGSVRLSGASLWSPASPTLYRAVTTLECDDKTVDRFDTEFGVRKVVFDADRGMLLNDQPVKLLGTCNHQDHAGVGVAIPDALQSYRVKLLKEMGSNALRTSHNAPTPELLQACDRMGMMVMDEVRTMASTPEGMDQLKRQIKRDRNHPSVVLWSLGNEEPEQGTARGARVVSTMQNLQRTLDPTRVATVAMNNEWGMGISNVIALQGFNYRVGKIDAYRKEHPNQPLIGSETASTTTTRGIYANDKTAGYLSAYGLSNPSWAEPPEGWWAFFDERPWLAGGFVWTGFDYRGEPTPYGWPCISSHFGLMDTCGFPKDIYYYYRAWWGNAPSLHVLPHWNAPPIGADGMVDVWAYSNQDAVELFVNGVSAGARMNPKNGHVSWKVKYAPGEIEVRGTVSGRVILTDRRVTAGAPARLMATVDRTQLRGDGRDVAVVNVAVTDAKGIVVPDARNTVAFKVTDGASVIGVGNGDPSCHEPDKASERSAFCGLLQAIIQAPRHAATVQVAATSPGLDPASLQLTVI
jgi:beta-galactosidase